MSQYTKSFRKEVLGYYHELKRKNRVVINGIEITKVVDLCNYLRISTYTLYDWEKERKRIESILAGKKLEDIPNKIKSRPSKKEDIEIRDIEEGKDIFGRRFYSWIARTMGIPKYSEMKINQLKHAIGKKLIKESGIE